MDPCASELSLGPARNTAAPLALAPPPIHRRHRQKPSGLILLQQHRHPAWQISACAVFSFPAAAPPPAKPQTQSRAEKAVADALLGWMCYLLRGSFLLLFHRKRIRSRSLALLALRSLGLVRRIVLAVLPTQVPDLLCLLKDARVSGQPPVTGQADSSRPLPSLQNASVKHGKPSPKP